MSPRLHREVVDALLTRVLAGEFPAGAQLPKEEDLAAEYDVSRGVAREALRALDERGVTKVRHGRGAVVQPTYGWDMLDAAVASAVLATRQRRSFEGELLEARMIVEGELAALAAGRAGQRILKELDKAAERSPEAILDLVADAARNRPLATAAVRLRRLTPKSSPTDAQLTTLLDAVRGGDGDAARYAVHGMYGS
jgi:DNA-binding FadR family transcriptional regulator